MPTQGLPPPSPAYSLSAQQTGFSLPRDILVRIPYASEPPGKPYEQKPHHGDDWGYHQRSHKAEAEYHPKGEVEYTRSYAHPDCQNAITHVPSRLNKNFSIILLMPSQNQ
jgi:hypothetical protein